TATPYSTTSSFLYSTPHPRALPSFPTRRSSDLTTDPVEVIRIPVQARRSLPPALHPQPISLSPGLANLVRRHGKPGPLSMDTSRSEEHTSELQSRVDLVCRLLLEKKKQQKKK